MNTRPLTVLNDDELIFRDAVAAFAKDRILPKVAEMDESSELDPTILSELFEMGLMGIEIPEEYGGAGGSFTTAVLAIEALAKVDPSVRCFGRPKHVGQQRSDSLGQSRSKGKIPA